MQNHEQSKAPQREQQGVTFSGLIQFAILIVAIIHMVLQIREDRS